MIACLYLLVELPEVEVGEVELAEGAWSQNRLVLSRLVKGFIVVRFRGRRTKVLLTKVKDIEHCRHIFSFGLTGLFLQHWPLALAL